MPNPGRQILVSLTDALSLLQRCENILGRSEYDTQFRTWRQRTRQTLITIFGADSPEVADFNKISFSLGVVSTGLRPGSEEERKQEEAFQQRFRQGKEETAEFIRCLESRLRLVSQKESEDRRAAQPATLPSASHGFPTAVIVRVMIASPSDLEEERVAAADIVAEWNAHNAAEEGVVLLPVKWEMHAVPTAGVRPQQAINDQLVATSDMVIAMFWTRLGSPTGVAEAGTVEEIGQFVESGKPAMIYFSKRPIDPSQINTEQFEKLRKYKSETYKNSLVGDFGTVAQFRDTLHRHLTMQVRALKKRHGF
jgi:hypothetical protein